MKKQEIRSRVKLALAVICVFTAGICYIGSRHAGGDEASGSGARLIIGGEQAGEQEEGKGAGEGEREEGLLGGAAGNEDGKSPGTELSGGGSGDKDASGASTSEAASGKEGYPGNPAGDSGAAGEALGRDSAGALAQVGENPGTGKGSEEAVIYVHVCGEVTFPGVYEMPAGSRVYEAVEMAGGCTENGAADYLNMAQEVTDGMKIQVPDKEEADRLLESQPGLGAGIFGGASSGAAGAGQAGAQAKVNINTASREELMTLTGIGEARAEDIIRYREENGGFKKIEDIMKVSGIKEAAFQKIKDSITV